MVARIVARYKTELCDKLSWFELRIEFDGRSARCRLGLSEMKSTVSRRFSVIGFFAAFIALCGIFVWQVLIASEREVNPVEIQQRLKITEQNALAPSDLDNPDDDLRLYAVNVIHTALPWRQPFVGYGVYLGQGLVLTAAHVVGRVPFVTHPRVLIAGMDLPATVIKEGSKEKTDLALVAIDQSRLPVILGLRKTPICNAPAIVGADVIVVYPERSVRSQIISPLEVDPQYRLQFTSLIRDPEGSGAALFDVESKCLRGIVSGKIEKTVRTRHQLNFAGYFMPARTISDFVTKKQKD